MEMSQTNVDNTKLPPWLARRVEVFQALADKGFTMEAIRFIAGTDGGAVMLPLGDED